MKRCSLCGADRPLLAFGANRQTKDGLYAYCRDCASLKNAKWKEEHPDYHRERNKVSAEERRAFIWKLKAETPCSDCRAFYDPWQMDFDHLPEHEKSFNLHACGTRTWISIIAEIAKCELVCANCHRTRTHLRSHAETED